MPDVSGYYAAEIVARLEAARAEQKRVAQERDNAMAELERSEAACASAMTEVEALKSDLEAVRVLFWPDGGARRVPQQRTDGMAAAVDWLLTQRVTLTLALDAAEAERDAMLPVVEAAKAWRQHVGDYPLPASDFIRELIAAVDALSTQDGA